MNPLSLFTSNSDSIPTFRAGLMVLAWTIIGLILIDIAINAALAYPSDPRFLSPSRLQLYFEYGRSSEGKLTRMTRCDVSKTAPITLAGWYSPLQIEQLPSSQTRPVVTFYGMSHTVRLARAFSRKSDHYSTRVVGAPGATGNWSFGAFLRDRGGGTSRVAVLGLMSVSTAMINSVASMDWSIDGGMPYTADRFIVTDHGLKAIAPPFVSFEDFCNTFTDSQKWLAAKDRLKQTDQLYNEFVMDANALDKSALFRLLRRAYGLRFISRARQTSLSKTGYFLNSEQVKTSRAIVRQFAAEARRGGIIPVVYLVNNLGYSDILFQSLRSALESDNIPYLSSSLLANPSDPRNYLADSHFTDEVDDKLASELERIIDRLVAD